MSGFFSEEPFEPEDLPVCTIATKGGSVFALTTAAWT
jgi:hypothetical protein